MHRKSLIRGKAELGSCHAGATFQPVELQLRTWVCHPHGRRGPRIWELAQGIYAGHFRFALLVCRAITYGYSQLWNKHYLKS